MNAIDISYAKSQTTATEVAIDDTRIDGKTEDV